MIFLRNVHVGFILKLTHCWSPFFCFSVTTNRKPKRWCSYRKVGGSK